jgi:hypothetical protein
METVNNLFPVIKKNCFDQTFQKINIEEELPEEPALQAYNNND